MKVQVLTTQNVEIEYEVASLGSRIGARLIDLLILFGYFVILIAILSSLGLALLSDDSHPGQRIARGAFIRRAQSDAEGGKARG